MAACSTVTSPGRACLLHGASKALALYLQAADGNEDDVSAPETPTGLLHNAFSILPFRRPGEIRRVSRDGR